MAFYMQHRNTFAKPLYLSLNTNTHTHTHHEAENRGQLGWQDEIDDDMPLALLGTIPETTSSYGGCYYHNVFCLLHGSARFEYDTLSTSEWMMFLVKRGTANGTITRRHRETGG